MKKLYYIIFISFAFCTSVFAGNLYDVKVQSNEEAEFLNSILANPILPTDNGYVVLIPDNSLSLFESSGLVSELLYSNISADNLYFLSYDSQSQFLAGELIYKFGDSKLVQIKSGLKSLSQDSQKMLMPVPDRTGKVYYNPPSASNISELTTIGGLDTLITKISQDSLESYLYRLEAFNGRLTGTDSCYASRDWIADKFREFGYTDVSLQPFTGRQLYSGIPVQSYNVVAVKTGAKYPDEQIVIGAHYDAVPTSPGSDDNGTGTAAVLELSRILYDIETDKTIIFVLFDSEESGLIGGYAYADNAKENNDNIVVMLNADMIGTIGNTDEANLFTGSEQGYANLWNDVVDSLVNIHGYLGTNNSSDHAAFSHNGYDVVFYHERLFSSVYHTYRDSTTYVDFEYMTRMTQGILATAYSVSQVPAPVQNIKITQTGTGTSLQIRWDLIDPTKISYYEVSYYLISNPSINGSIQVNNTSDMTIIENLVEGSLYNFYVNVYDYNGNSSVVYDIISGKPSSTPATPLNFKATPQYLSIKLTWSDNNEELNFDHYELFRDSAFFVSITDTIYIDDSPEIGSDLHEYYVLAVSSADKKSPLDEATRIITRAATLEPHRILALNRSNLGSSNLVNVSLTGTFMKDALVTYNFDYYADTAYSKLNQGRPRFSLLDMLDYEIVVIGGESGLYDDLASSDASSNLSEILRTYLEIGGKVVIFGRWGLLSSSETLTTYTINSPSYLQMYSNIFNITSRLSSEATLEIPAYIHAELRGAKSLQTGYPNLVFDSVITAQHTSPYIPLGGIPLASCVTLNSSDAEPIYNFESLNPLSNLENKSVAWKNLTGPNKYIFFDIPLSFFEKTNAMIALRKAVDELSDIPTDIADNGGSSLPKQFELAQNYPNPFNPSTTIKFSLPERMHTTITVYNILGQEVKTLTDKEYPAGNYQVTWDGNNSYGKPVASGIYLYKISSEDFSASKKMLLLK